ncbi:MAG TPA: DoxX family membrane protein [Burkholderiales bacterium]|nr:DoxX family membrane protein [Burkholderiales bacterium]
MFQDHTPLQAAGQLLLAFAFLATGIRNAGWKFRQHLERMLAYRVPRARLVLTAGLALQFTGASLLALDLCRPLASALLVAFTVSASAIFHRWWLIGDPLLSHLHLSNLLVNCGVVGGLLLVAAI